jgi:glycosyltransferase involved in cell wall biosynthesis
MRIGIISGEYPPMQGGVGAYTQILAHELAKQGHFITLFSSYQARSDDLSLVNKTRKWNFVSLRNIRDWANANKLDVVNLQFQTAAYGMSPWPHFVPDYLRSIPVVTTFHDLRPPYLFPKAGALRGWIVRHLAHTSSGVIVTNHEDEQEIKHLPRTALIPIGSNILSQLPEDYQVADWREKTGAEPDDFLLAYFGLMNRSKGVDILLESMSLLRKQGAPVRLVIIGGQIGSSDSTNAAYTQEITAKIAKYRLDPYIVWTGFVNDVIVSAYLAASDVVALPFLDGASYRRGSLMAAIRYNCAIVTTQPRVSIPTFVHGENMLFVPPGDSSALAETLHDLLHNPQQREHLRQGAARLSQHFDWTRIAADYIDFLQQITGAVLA